MTGMVFKQYGARSSVRVSGFYSTMEYYLCSTLTFTRPDGVGGNTISHTQFLDCQSTEELAKEYAKAAIIDYIYREFSNKD